VAELVDALVSGTSG